MAIQHLHNPSIIRELLTHAQREDLNWKEYYITQGCY